MINEANEPSSACRFWRIYQVETSTRPQSRTALSSRESPAGSRGVAGQTLPGKPAESFRVFGKENNPATVDRSTQKKPFPRSVRTLTPGCSGTSIAEQRPVKIPGNLGLCLLWLLTASAGAWVLLDYENTPAAVGATPPTWPADSAITVQPDRPTLLLFAHPHCPCSRATLEELNRLVTRCTGPVTVVVLFIRPAGVTDDWTVTSLRKSAEAIPGINVRLDPDGREANRFGAESSGQVVLYNSQGRLLFSGGITAARGHAGDNAGENVVVALVNGQNANIKQTAVFGCSLQDGCPTSK
jgi:hypothetical protein